MSDGGVGGFNNRNRTTSSPPSRRHNCGTSANQQHNSMRSALGSRLPEPSNSLVTFPRWTRSTSTRLVSFCWHWRHNGGLVGCDSKRTKIRTENPKCNPRTTGSESIHRRESTASCFLVCEEFVLISTRSDSRTFDVRLRLKIQCLLNHNNSTVLSLGRSLARSHGVASSQTRFETSRSGSRPLSVCLSVGLTNVDCYKLTVFTPGDRIFPRARSQKLRTRTSIRQFIRAIH